MQLRNAAAFPVAIRCHDINILLRHYSDSSEVPSKVSPDLGDGLANGHGLPGRGTFLVVCCFDVTGHGEANGKRLLNARLSLNRDLVVGTRRPAGRAFRALKPRRSTKLQ
jgi:hypothetical protein